MLWLARFGMSGREPLRKILHAVEVGLIIINKNKCATRAHICGQLCSTENEYAKV